MDIELSRLRHKKQGYQSLDASTDSPTTANGNGNGNAMSSSRTGRTYGYKDDSKNKKKGKGRYQDEPEDEVDLLGADEFAEDEETAEQARPTREVVMVRFVCIA